MKTKLKNQTFGWIREFLVPGVCAARRVLLFFAKFPRPENSTVPRTGQMLIRQGLAAAITLISAAILAGGRPLYAGTTCFVQAGGYSNYGSIQAAVNDRYCATIKVAPGTYNEQIQISRDVSIVGSGAANTTISSAGNSVIKIYSGSVKMESVTIERGSEGIHKLGSGKLYVLNCIVGGNFSSGVSTEDGIVQIEDSTVESNSISWSGGSGITITSGTMNIVRSMIAGNANGIYLSTAWRMPIPTVTISNSTIQSNKTGIYNFVGTLSISSSTIANNQGPGINNQSINTRIKSSIIANNNGSNCVSDRPGDGGYNLRWPPTDGSCVGSYGDPKLSGGWSTSSNPFRFWYEPMIPLFGSAAIGKGACSDLNGVAVPVDERLYVRPASGCDIGAVESRSTTSALPDAAWWRLDEGSGTTARDSSAHGVNGTVYSSGGAPQWNSAETAPTLFYNASSLYSGALNSHVATPIPTTRTDNLAFSMWVNCGGCGSYRNDFVIFYNGQLRWDGYGLYVPASDRRLKLIVNGAVHDFGYTLPTTGTWTHLAVVRASGWWRLFVNGKPVGPASVRTPNTPVGHASIGADTYGGENFGGLIDDVRVYNRALSPGEIAWVATGDR